MLYIAIQKWGFQCFCYPDICLNKVFLIFDHFLYVAFNETLCLENINNYIYFLVRILSLYL